MRDTPADNQTCLGTFLGERIKWLSREPQASAAAVAVAEFARIQLDIDCSVILNEAKNFARVETLRFA